METSEIQNGKICDLCKVSPSKYVCPRCGVHYCSLLCYRSSLHLSCSESFYRDCVTSELKGLPAQDEASMMATLERFKAQQQEQEEEEEDELDSDDEEPLAQRLAGIDLDNAEQVWSTLTEEERTEFGQFVGSLGKDGELQEGQIVEEWEPWWEKEPSKPALVEEINKPEENTTDTKQEKEGVPPILPSIPPMVTLTKVKPNQHVALGLTNVIAAYVWCSRLYNGEFLQWPNTQEVLAGLVNLSSFLGNDAVFSSFQHALADVGLNACKIPELFDGGPALQATLSKDVYRILNGGQSASCEISSALTHSKMFILSALSECYRLVEKVIQSEKKKKNKQEPPSDFEKRFPTGPGSFSSYPITLEPKLVRKTRRKLYYLLAFANEHPILPSLTD